MIVVVDYNVGNVKSVCNAFAYIGCDAQLSREPERIRKASGLVLPGVAAFGYAIRQLSNLDKVIKEAALGGKPLLGICVGHQLLFERSYEHGQFDGLGLIKGEVRRLPAGRVIPHMGWNKVQIPENMELLNGLGSEKFFYFAHSYYTDVADADADVVYADYGFPLPASVRKVNIYGTQFHPEKSGPNGLQVLRNFARICSERDDLC